MEKKQKKKSKSPPAPPRLRRYYSVCVHPSRASEQSSVESYIPLLIHPNENPTRKVLLSGFREEALGLINIGLDLIGLQQPKQDDHQQITPSTSHPDPLQNFITHPSTYKSIEPAEIPKIDHRPKG